MYSIKNNPTVAAIIAEYNPFHNGHLYQIEQTKKELNADYILVIMSGDFVERGEPSIINKYLRTKMALLGGADLVLELPALYAISCAQIFAKGAISILNSLNCVDYLSFGSESGNINDLVELSKLILNTENDISDELSAYLKEGLSYPKAQELILNKKNAKTELLKHSNNILAIEYIKSLLNSQSQITPFTILRNDNGYNNGQINPEYTFASATSIRNALKNDRDSLRSYIPDTIYNLLPSELVNIDDFSDLLYYKLLCEKHLSFDSYLDVNEELSHKIIKHIPNYTSFSDFVNLLKSKNLTQARIQRALFHILFDIKYDDIKYTNTYARILGFKKDSTNLLNIIKQSSAIPLISKLSDAKMTSMLNKDIYCANLYEQITKSKINEMRMSPIIL